MMVGAVMTSAKGDDAREALKLNPHRMPGAVPSTPPDRNPEPVTVTTNDEKLGAREGVVAPLRLGKIAKATEPAGMVDDGVAIGALNTANRAGA